MRVLSSELLATILIGADIFGMVCILSIWRDAILGRVNALIALGTIGFITMVLPLSTEVSDKVFGENVAWALIQGFVMLCITAIAVLAYYVLNPNFFPGQERFSQEDKA